MAQPNPLPARLPDLHSPLFTLRSRFQRYIDTWPGPTEVVNSCNIDLKYTKMWKSPYWVGTLARVAVGYLSVTQVCSSYDLHAHLLMHAPTS